MNELVAIPIETLREFLQSCENNYWETVNETSPDTSMEMSHVTTEELIDRFNARSENGLVYVFGPSGVDPIEAADKADFSALPTLRHPEELNDYTFPSGGQDFLYISLQETDAANAHYLTLLRRDG